MLHIDIITFKIWQLYKCKHLKIYKEKFFFKIKQYDNINKKK